MLQKHSHLHGHSCEWLYSDSTHKPGSGCVISIAQGMSSNANTLERQKVGMSTSVQIFLESGLCLVLRSLGCSPRAQPQDREFAAAGGITPLALPGGPLAVGQHAQCGLVGPPQVGLWWGGRVVARAAVAIWRPSSRGPACCACGNGCAQFPLSNKVYVRQYKSGVPDVYAKTCAEGDMYI